ncbi:hypothetical protein FIV36_25035 [Pseudomonas extremaustralis]|uniref:Uncharacterized protein n=1 Tax=Pseudomonas extremaustralis TaxID=359110 RepID=A0A5C5Q6U1_9PSED|nr:hypothetical protein FIV36_25035 [Pseudomonas extremaustralis]
MPTPGGASLLAKTVNDNAGNLAPPGALGVFASELAPTGGQVYSGFEICVHLRASIGPRLLSLFFASDSPP